MGRWQGLAKGGPLLASAPVVILRKLALATVLLVLSGAAPAAAQKYNDPDLYKPAPVPGSSDDKVIPSLPGRPQLSQQQVDAGVALTPQPSPPPSKPARPHGTKHKTHATPAPTASGTAHVVAVTGVPVAVRAGDASRRADAGEGGALLALLLGVGLPCVAFGGWRLLGTRRG